MGDGIIAVDLAGRILYANAATERLLDWPEGELIGTHVYQLFPTRLQDWMGEDFAAFVDERLPELSGRTIEGQLVRRSGAELPVEVMVSKVPAGPGDSVVVGVLRQRRAERLSRWSELTQRLFDTVAHPDDATPAQEQILAALGTELGWEATALWSLESDGSLVRRAVWIEPGTDPDRRLHRPAPNGPPTGPPWRCMPWSRVSRCGSPT